MVALMGAKINIRLDVMNVLDRTNGEFQKAVKEEFGDQLINSIKKGVNPVRGGEVKQIQYSESYKNAIRKGYVKGKTKISPVDLKQTGALHDSLTIFDTEKGVRVLFTDEKAIYHNELGVGKSKVKRRLLPTGDGEMFNSSLFVRLVKYVKESIAKATK